MGDCRTNPGNSCYALEMHASSLHRISRGALRVVLAREFATKSFSANVQKFDVKFSGPDDGRWFIATDPPYKGTTYESEVRSIEVRLQAKYFMTN